MANKKINDLALAGSASATMQLETDIGGITANKITAAQVKTFVNDGLAGGKKVGGGTLTTETLLLRNNSVDDLGVDINGDGSLTVNTPNYETLVTADDDIPNKKYVDDSHPDTMTEVLTISGDGQTAFTLGNTPAAPAESILVLNGQIRLYTTDFTISGTSLTWNDPGGLTLKTTDTLQIWYNITMGTPTAPITSVFSRVGVVTAQSGDYTVGQVTGAAASSANSDITSLSGLTTPLSIAQGGTNSTTALANDKVMISSAGSVVESPTITTTELGLLDGIASVSTGAGDNDKFVTQGYVDDLAPPTNITLYTSIEGNANQGNHRTRTIAAAGSFNYEFAIPNDFNALVSLELIISPRTGAGGTGKNVDLSSSYGTFGEVINIHSETDATSTYDFGNVGEFKNVSVASVFTSLSAGDICGLNWDNNLVGGTIDTYFIKLVYTR